MMRLFDPILQKAPTGGYTYQYVINIARRSRIEIPQLHQWVPAPAVLFSLQLHQWIECRNCESGNRSGPLVWYLYLPMHCQAIRTVKLLWILKEYGKSYYYIWYLYWHCLLNITSARMRQKNCPPVQTFFLHSLLFAENNSFTLPENIQKRPLIRWAFRVTNQLWIQNLLQRRP